MNRDVMQGNWKQMRGSLKKFFGKLTDDDVIQAEGDQDKMIGKLQERYGYTREQAQVEWNKFVAKYGNAAHDVAKDDVSKNL